MINKRLLQINRYFCIFQFIVPSIIYKMATALSQKNDNQSERDVVLTQAPKLCFSLLTKVYEIVGSIKGENSKNKQKAHLINMFKQLARTSVDDLVMGYWLSVMKIGPDYQRNELGIGKQILIKAVAKSCGMTEKQVRQHNIKTGDLGQVAQNSKSSQKTLGAFFTKKKVKAALTIDKVFTGLKKISTTKGNNSNTEKESILLNLLLQSENEQTKFIVRWVQGNLKIAAAERTMQMALISALFEQYYPYEQQIEENLREYEFQVKKAMAQYPNQEKIIKTLVEIKGDIKRLSEICKLTPGIPCKPMLAKPTKGISFILSRFQGKRMTCEYKYDGLRGQIHFYNGVISIYSRNLQNLTESYPDIVDQIKKNMANHPQIQLNSFIIDCEIVAVNQKTKQIFPFQVLATRARKATNIQDIEVHINLFAFDCLYYNEPVTHLKLSQRREILVKKLQPLFSDFLNITEHREEQEFDKIDGFLQDAIKFGTEGLMIKDLDSEYTCSKRSWEWVKLKKDYIDGVGDTLDVVPIGAFYGEGKRKGLFGSYLLAIYNSDMQVYETICKIGTGFSDEVLQKAHQFFKDKVVTSCPREYRTASNIKVDVWFPPAAVWEIKGADFQLSPIYTCGIGDVDSNRGIGLRFPRLLKVREDKKPEEATNSQFVIDLYNQQASIQNKMNQKEDQDDFY